VGGDALDGGGGTPGRVVADAGKERIQHRPGDLFGRRHGGVVDETRPIQYDYPPYGI
jgi:hypothetical protein